MEEIKKGLNKLYSVSLFTSVVILVLGIFLFMYPGLVIKMISVVLGILILIPGITSLIDYFKSKYQPGLITGVITILISMILIIKTELVASILPFVLGIYFVINGINRFIYAFELKKQNVTNYTVSLVFSILIVICGILFIIDPFEGALEITKITGIFMIVYAVLDLSNSIIIKMGLHNLNNKEEMKNAVIEVEVVDNND